MRTSDASTSPCLTALASRSRWLRGASFLLAVAGGVVAPACRGGALDAVDAVDGGSGAGTGDDDGSAPPPSIMAHADKVDLLFVVDNSSGMATKQAMLARSIPGLVSRLVTPNCIDTQGAVVGVSDPQGDCAAGHPEFRPVADMHLGVVTTSLGGFGSGSCDATTPNQVNQALNAHDDDQGHLVIRAGADEHPVAAAQTTGFLSWFADTPANTGKPAPSSAVRDVASLTQSLADMIGGVHDGGCGYEQPLEAMYRFLVEPDPYASTALVDQTEVPSGVDATILRQRHDFLRPDSLVLVVLLTDESDASLDPLGFGGRSWMFDQPGQHVRGGTSACATNPDDPACQSCYLAGTQGDPACGGPLTGAQDSLNLRYFHMKQRFGADPQFPLARYQEGLLATTVPDRVHEHPVDAGLASFNYAPESVCTNPLFAAALPAGPGDELCHLPLGPRAHTNLVYFATIVGVPWQLLTTDPTNLGADNTAPAKRTLDAADYQRLLGADPLAYRFEGVDPHMIESSVPRAGVTGDWNTGDTYLQFACTWPLDTPIDCAAPANQTTCKCSGDAVQSASPLCAANPNDGGKRSLQIADGATPAVRPIALARDLTTQGIVTSICPRPGTPAGGVTSASYADPLTTIVDRISVSLAQ